MRLSYQFKTKPFDHQRRIFEETKDLAAYALNWEQGTGKSKPMIDTAAYLFQQGKIDAVFIIAPNGVHRNWLNDEVPLHLPNEVLKQSSGMIYLTPKADTKYHQKAVKEVQEHKGLAWLSMTYEALMTKRGKATAWKFLRDHKVFYILDEAHKIKHPGAKRTISIVASGKHAVYRRTLTGTPISKGPFDIYAMIRFLDHEFWKRVGLSSFRVFKFKFGEWLTRSDAVQKLGFDPGYDQLIDYKNIDELIELTATISDRVTKDDELDLPPKLYTKRYFDLSKEQKAIYAELKAEYMLEIGGTIVDAPLAIVRLSKFHQITRGYVMTDLEEPVVHIPGGNPALNLLKEICEELFHPTIIWCRWREDVNQIMEMLGKIEGARVGRYDGAISDDECAETDRLMKAGELDFVVATPAKGSEGLNWVKARTAIYYSQSFNSIHRWQSEDRNHRIGQEYPVNYIDIIAPGTVDTRIVEVLRENYDIAAKINQDDWKEWI